MRHAELLGHGFALRVHVDADDLVGARHACALDDIEADAAEAEHDHIRAGLHFRGVDDRADAGGDAATDVADLLERRVLADLRQRDLGQHRVVRERAAAHVVVHFLVADGEAAGAIGHHTLALRGANRGAQIGLVRGAGFALPAFRRVQRNDVVAFFERGHAGPDVNNDARALVPENHREQPFRIAAGAGELIGVTDAGRLDFDQHFTGLGTGEIDGGDFQRLAGLPGDGSAGLHCFLPPSTVRRMVPR
jgi:hypothetical protein